MLAPLIDRLVGCYRADVEWSRWLPSIDLLPDQSAILHLQGFSRSGSSKEAMSDENAQRREGGTRSIILQSDQEKGMALVQSKDGRTKWLTVRCGCFLCG